jgi:transmembrane sensor
VPHNTPRNTALFNRLIEGKLAPGDVEELVQWLGADDQDPETVGLILQQLQRAGKTNELSPDIISRLEARLPLVFAAKNREASVVSVFRKKWLPYAAATLILAVAGTLFFMKGNQKQIDSQNNIVQATPVEIEPGKTGAILTLDDNTTVVLDSLGNGLVTNQNGTKVLLRNGQLLYQADKTQAIVAYNTMTTPKGRQFQLVLSDGTKVWLNAASSIRYPTVFGNKERKVEITGEAYFEVAHNASAPFKVKVNAETEIEVLGTHFNINSYENEESINTTLLEGSVRVKNISGTIVLAPGQQARVNGEEKIKVFSDVDVERVMAWKNGVFNFNDATLQEVMRQLERWYDIEVRYEKGVPGLEFYGKMGKDLSLQTVLRGLEKSNVHFRLEEGRKLVVLP